MFRLSYIFIFIFVFSNFISINDSIADEDSLTFSSIDLENNTIDSETYYGYKRKYNNTARVFIC